MKADIDTIIDALTLSGITGEPRKEFLKTLERRLNEEKAEKESNKIPKRRNQHIVILKTAVIKFRTLTTR